MNNSFNFVKIQCCGSVVDCLNPRRFTRASDARFMALQQKLGSTWLQDLEAKGLVADTAFCEAYPDGFPILFGCRGCGASFVLAGGVPVKGATA